MKSRFAVGIDLGGTNVRAARVAPDGTMDGFVMHAIDKTLDGEGYARMLAALAREAAGRSAPAAVGVAVPGTLRDPDRTILEGSCNVPAIEGFPLGTRIATLVGAPAAVDNDADLAAWGESWLGAAKGAKAALVFTLGTGIGTGLVVNGKLWRGAHGQGSEYGISRVPAFGALGDRRWVALEEVASGEAMKKLGGAPNEVLFARAAQGDADARRAVDRLCEALALAAANAHALLDLDLVLLCGGLAKEGRPLLDGVRRHLPLVSVPPWNAGLTVELGTLGDRAGIAGAAALAFSLLRAG